MSVRENYELIGGDMYILSAVSRKLLSIMLH